MEKPEIQSVKVIDIDMPFWSMMNFMVKWALAAIPAMLILMVFGTVVVVALGGLLGLNGAQGLQ